MSNLNNITLKGHTVHCTTVSPLKSDLKCFFPTSPPCTMNLTAHFVTGMTANNIEWSQQAFWTMKGFYDCYHKCTVIFFTIESEITVSKITFFFSLFQIGLVFVLIDGCFCLLKKPTKPIRAL